MTSIEDITTPKCNMNKHDKKESKITWLFNKQWHLQNPMFLCPLHKWILPKKMQGFGNWATNDVEEKDGGGEVEAKLLLFVTLFWISEFFKVLK